MSDPLGTFRVWDGGPLGDDRTEAEPGLDYGQRVAPKDLLHIAGAWAMSSARRDRAGELHPVSYVRIVARVVGAGATYHVLDGVIEADVAEEWATVLRETAAASRRDVRAAKAKGR